MKRYIPITLLVLLSLVYTAFAGPPSPPQGPTGQVETSTVAGLPANPVLGDVRYVTDGDSATDCTTGSSTTKVLCTYNGSAWVAVQAAAGGSGDLLADGSVPLTDNWDVGAFTITGTRFISDIATGTAPFGVSSTTEVTNLRSATASALAANGGNCTSGQSPLGVDAAGAVESCFDVWTEAENTAAGYGVGDVLADGSVPFTDEITVDENGIEFQETDTLTDCSTFAATGGGIFYDDSEGKFKKCQDNSLTDLDTGGSETNSLETTITGIADTEIFVGDGADSGAFVSVSGDGSLANTGALSVTDLTISSEAQGDVLYFNGTNWVRLAPGTDGHFLKTQGAAANPLWAAPPGGGDITAVGACANGECFTDGSTTSTSLIWEMTDNAFETTLTASEPQQDNTITLPDQTGSIVLGPASFAADNILVKTNGTESLTQATGITVDDSNNVSGVGTIGSGAITSSGAVTGSSVTDGTVTLAGDGTVTGISEGGLPNSIIVSTDIKDGEVAAADLAATLDISGKTITFGLEASDIPDISATYEVVDAEIARFDTADTVGADWEWQDGIAQSFGNDNDWEIAYDETTDDRLEFTHTAGAGADAYFDLNDNAADSTFTVTNSDGTYEANASIEGDLAAGGNLTVTGTATITGALTADTLTAAAADDAKIAFDPETANESAWWIGINNDSVGDDNDNFEIRQSATPGSSVEFLVQPDGDVVATGDLTITGDDLFLTTNTSGFTLVADGTNYNPVAFSGDVALAANGATTVGDLTITSEAQGNILYFDGSGWEALAPGTDGYYLETNGAGANPTWSAVSASAAGANTNVQYNSSGNLGAEAAFTYTAASNLLTVENITTTGTILANLVDTTGAADIDIGSADVTDVTLITDGGVDSLTIGSNLDLDYGFTINADTNDFTLNWDEDNAELELTSVGDEDLVIDLDTATDNEVAFTTGTGVTQLNFNAFNLLTTGTIFTNALDAVGAVDMDYGSGDITDHTFTTDDSTFIIDGGITVSTGDNIALGAVQWNSGDNIDGTKVADADLGDIDVSTGAWTLDTDVVAAAEMADADHGDVSWTSGVALVEGVGSTIALSSATGVLTVAAATGTNNENLTIDLETTANTATIGTGTGVTVIDAGTLNFATTGTITGGVSIVTTTAATLAVSATQALGVMHINGDNDAIDYTLPTAVAGYSACFMQGQGAAGAITVQPNTGDYLVVDGVRGTPATDYASTGAGGDKICVVAVSADDWIVTTESGTWSE